MSDEKIPDHETIERVFKTEPAKILESLPDGIAKRRAEALLPTVYDYVVESRESVKRPPALSVGDDGRLRWSGLTVQITEWWPTKGTI